MTHILLSLQKNTVSPNMRKCRNLQKRKEKGQERLCASPLLNMFRSSIDPSEPHEAVRRHYSSLPAKRGVSTEATGDSPK